MCSLIIAGEIEPTLCSRYENITMFVEIKIYDISCIIIWMLFIKISELFAKAYECISLVIAVGIVMRVTIKVPNNNNNNNNNSTMVMMMVVEVVEVMMIILTIT